MKKRDENHLNSLFALYSKKNRDKMHQSDNQQSGHHRLGIDQQKEQLIQLDDDNRSEEDESNTDYSVQDNMYSDVHGRQTYTESMIKANMSTGAAALADRYKFNLNKKQNKIHSEQSSDLKKKVHHKRRNEFLEPYGDGSYMMSGLNVRELTPSAPPPNTDGTKDEIISRIQRIQQSYAELNKKQKIKTIQPEQHDKTINCVEYNFIISAGLSMTLDVGMDLNIDPKLLMYRLLIQNFTIDRRYLEIACLITAIMVENSVLEIHNGVFTIKTYTTRYFKGYLAMKPKMGNIVVKKNIKEGIFVGNILFTIQIQYFNLPVYESLLMPMNQYLQIILNVSYQLALKDYKWVIINETVNADEFLSYMSYIDAVPLLDYLELYGEDISLPPEFSDLKHKEEYRPVEKYKRILGFNIGHLLKNQKALTTVIDHMNSGYKRSREGFNVFPVPYGKSIANVILRIITDSRYVDFIRKSAPVDILESYAKLSFFYGNEIPTEKYLKDTLTYSVWKTYVLAFYFQQNMSLEKFIDPTGACNSMLMATNPLFCDHLDCYLTFWMLVCCARYGILTSDDPSTTLDNWTEFKFACRNELLKAFDIDIVVNTTMIPGLKHAFGATIKTLSELKTDVDK